MSGHSGCVIHRNILIPGSAGRPMLLDIFSSGSTVVCPVVIFCHGFKGFKDWGHFDLVAKAFCAGGFAYVRFNFSHNGTTPDDPLNFNDPEAFGQNNYVIELDDLGLVIDWVVSNAAEYNFDPGQIFLLGHSRGGGISILKAAEDKRIKKLVTWASVCDLAGRNRPSTLAKWKKEGVIYSFNARTGQQMPLYYQFHETILAHATRLDMRRAAEALSIPVLIVHGDADEAVPFAEAQQLHSMIRDSRLMRVPGGSHTFGARHPWTAADLPAHSAGVTEATIGFLREA